MHHTSRQLFLENFNIMIQQILSQTNTKNTHNFLDVHILCCFSFVVKVFLHEKKNQLNFDDKIKNLKQTILFGGM